MRRRCEPTHERPADGHAHRFIIERPRAATSRGECATCHEVREFDNTLDRVFEMTEEQRAQHSAKIKRSNADRAAAKAAEADAMNAMAAEDLT